MVREEFPSVAQKPRLGGKRDGMTLTCSVWDPVRYPRRDFVLTYTRPTRAPCLPLNDMEISECINVDMLHRFSVFKLCE